MFLNYFTVSRYLKQELVAKGGLAATAIPSEYQDTALKKKPMLIFSKDQRQRFKMVLLLTGGWFLESQTHHVHKEEKHLVLQIPETIDAPHVALQVDDDDNDFCILPGAPPPPPPAAPKGRGKAGGSRKRRKKEPTPEPEEEEEHEENAEDDAEEEGEHGDVPIPEEFAGNGYPDIKQFFFFIHTS